MVGTDQIKDVEKRVLTIIGDDCVAVPGCGLGSIEEENGPVCRAEMSTVWQHEFC